VKAVGNRNAGNRARADMLLGSDRSIRPSRKVDGFGFACADGGVS